MSNQKRKRVTENLRGGVAPENALRGRRDWPALAAIFFVAVVLRLAQWAAAAKWDPFYADAPPHFDMHTYRTWSLAIADGDWSSAGFTIGEPFFYGPLYPYVCAVVMAIFGRSSHVIHFAQLVLGACVPLVVFATARLIYDRRNALVSGLLAAVAAPVIFYEQVLLMEGLLYALYAVLLWALVRCTVNASRFAALAGGLCAGLICLGRSNLLLLLPVLAPGLWWFSIGDRRKRIVVAGLFVAGAVLPLSISLARNVAVSGKWVLTTANGPMNLYIGNAPDSTGVLQLPPSFIELVKQHGSEAAVPWGDALRAQLSRSSGHLLPLFLKKLYLFWNSYDAADNVSYYAYSRYYPWIRWNPLSWVVVCALGLSGAWLTRSTWRKTWPLYAFAVGIPVTIALVFVLGRYRLPVMLPLFILMAVAVIEFFDALRRRDLRPVMVIAAVSVAVLVVLMPRLSPAARQNRGAGASGTPLIRVNDYVNLSRGQFTRGLTTEAIRLLEEGHRAYPVAPLIIANLTDYYINAKQAGKAVALLEQYVSRYGTSPGPEQLLRKARAAAQ